MIYTLHDDYYVRPLCVSDLTGPYPSWFEDQAVCRYNSHGKFFKTEGWFRTYVENLDAEDRVVWAICHATAGHIGNVSLQGLSFINRSAEFAIILGAPGHSGKGVATAASRQLLRHGFDKLNLHRVYCGTAATNSGMIRLASAMGMTEEGRRRQALFLDGAWVDMLEFGVLREEFK